MKEGRKHGRRSHLVQYERHCMEEQKTGGLKERGADTSTVREQGAKRGEKKGA